MLPMCPATFVTYVPVTQFTIMMYAGEGEIRMHDCQNLR